jgi:short-subunit dehydrogenase
MIIVDGSEDELQALDDDLSNKYNVAIIPIAKDLIEPDAPREIYDEIKDKGLVVDILVNDAGQGDYSAFTEMDIRRELKMIQLNVASTVYLTRLFLADMLANNEGKILNVASLNSTIPAPLQAVYRATRAFVYSFSQSLINDLKGSDVTMLTLLPSATENDFLYKAGMENTNERKKFNLPDPADLARAGYQALVNGNVKVVSDLKDKFTLAVSNIVSGTERNNLGAIQSGQQQKTAPGKTIDIRGDDSRRRAAGDWQGPINEGRHENDVNARSSGRQFSSSSFDDEDNIDR